LAEHQAQRFGITSFCNDVSEPGRLRGIGPRPCKRNSCALSETELKVLTQKLGTTVIFDFRSISESMPLCPEAETLPHRQAMLRALCAFDSNASIAIRLGDRRELPPKNDKAAVRFPERRLC
jgi:hypothetical protein